jgi:hypothetical protein
LVALIQLRQASMTAMNAGEVLIAALEERAGLRALVIP